MKSKKSVFPILFCVMLAFVTIISVSIAARNERVSLAEAEYGRTAPFVDGWHTADGTELDEKALKKINSIAGDKEISIYNTLPAGSNDADALFFRAKNVFYSVYIDGEAVYVPDFGESVFYTKSTGTRWTSIDITPDQLGKEIEIKIRAAYENARCGVDSFSIGSSGGIILNILGEKIVSFITCVLLMFVGLILIVADIPINMGKHKNHELMYLGVFSISVSIWCLVELHIIELFFDDSRLMQVISCCSLMLIPFALILYLNAAIGFKNRFLIPVLSGLCVLGFAASWTLHLLKIKDIHETLTFSHVNVVIASVLLVYSIIKGVIIKGKGQSGKIYRILKAMGLCSIAVAAMIDIVRFYSGQTGDSAQFVRIGMLIFTICYGSSSLENTVNAVKLGAQAEFASRLAYHDGLTGIGNRTAFEEKLASLETEKSEKEEKDDNTAVGIVMFDVNDLKYVNDNLGHPTGDEMIRKAAEIISAAFEADGGECFRIGGDEFAVIIKGDSAGDVKASYEKGMLIFDEQTKRHNGAPDSKFRVSIAHGFFIFNNDCELEHIEDAYKMADKKMYETKRAMKALQSTPEEYYASRRTRVGV
ncbi:MAG: GGDEF domain-containing protein [Oscillospiraceae bacterium]|nr:GGDEF domain-containing protein [Oscillospiraceae bacterium]